MSAKHAKETTRHHHLRSLVIALVVSIGLFTAFLMYQRPYFYTNDDTMLQSILCGAQTGEPNPYTIYTNYWLSCGIVGLYHVFPNVAWWFFILEFSQFLVLFLWCYLTHRIVERRLLDSARHSNVYSIAVVILSGASWSYLPVVRPSYTFASACLSAIGAVLFYVVMDCTWLTAGERRVFIPLSVIMQAFGCTIRYRSGIVGIVFTCAIAAVFLAKSIYEKVRRVDGDAHHSAWKRSLVLCLVPICSVALALGGQAMHHRAYDTEEWRAFDQVNKARSAFMDYPHDLYEDNPTLYEEVEWDEPLADLVQSWFFMDRRVTEEAFVHIVEGSTTQSASPWWSLADNFITHKGIFVDGLFLCMAAVTASLGHMLQVYCADDGWNRILGILMLIIGLCATGYLASMGRMLFRTAYCSLLPAVFVMWFTLLEHMSSVPGERYLQRPYIVFCGVMTLLIVIVVVLWIATVGIPAYAFCLVGLVAPLVTLSFVFYRQRPVVKLRAMWLLGLALVSATVLSSTQQSIVSANTLRIRYVNLVEAMSRNAREHPETIYIYPPQYSSTDPFQGLAENEVSWGGWSYFAPWKPAMFDRLGYPDGLYAEAFFDENVYFVSINKKQEQALRFYLKSIAGRRVKVELVDNIGEDIKVYSYSLV